MASTSTREPSSAMTEFPNWLKMPDDLMENILQRLDTVEILQRAWKVCTTWRRMCKNPATWKVIDMHKSVDDDFERLTKQAVDLSCGELIDISLNGIGTDALLDYIVLRSSKLNRLSLWNCYHMTSNGLSRAIKRLPQLEYLHLFHTPIDAEDIENIGRNCPQLKSFTMAKRFPSWFGGFCIKCDDHALAIANNMPELRNLVLVDGEMTNDGLQAILIGCPHLRSLHLSQTLDLDVNLGKLCMERFKDFKHRSI